MRQSFLVVCLMLFGFAGVVVANSSPTSEKTSAVPTAEDIRCQKLTGTNIGDFKASLVENCDLSKPFSTSLSRLLNEDTYFYCCQKRK